MNFSVIFAMIKISDAYCRQAQNIAAVQCARLALHDELREPPAPTVKLFGVRQQRRCHVTMKCVENGVKVTHGHDVFFVEINRSVAS